MNNSARLIISVLFCEGAGLIGAVFTGSSVNTWYAVLNKPSFSPPNFVFAPVWTTLYFLMGVALFLIWKNKSPKKKKLKEKGIQVFLLQLFLNVLWSVAFFGLHSPLLGLIAIVFLWALIFETIRQFSKVDKTSAFLLYPYIVWVSLALVLNFEIFRLNMLPA